jgi:hypothetical protein
MSGRAKVEWTSTHSRGTGRGKKHICLAVTPEAKARAVQNELPLTPLSSSWLAVARAVSRAVGQPVMFSP